MPSTKLATQAREYWRLSQKSRKDFTSTDAKALEVLSNMSVHFSITRRIQDLQNRLQTSSKRVA